MRAQKHLFGSLLAVYALLAACSPSTGSARQNDAGPTAMDAGHDTNAGQEASTGGDASHAGSDAEAGGGDAATGRSYPLHTGIISTTFWVGEIFDPTSPDGSQVISTYDSAWMTHYGGCDGVIVSGKCETEARTAQNGYFPNHMTPHENPFYLDLPFDDVNDSNAFAQRTSVIPWANDPGYAGHTTDQNFS